MCFDVYLIAMYIVSICFSPEIVYLNQNYHVKVILLLLLLFFFLLEDCTDMQDCTPNSAFWKVLGVRLNGRKLFERNKQIEKLTLQKILCVCVCVDLCERLNGKSFCVKSFVRFVKQLWKFRYSSDERLQFSPDFLLHVCVNARTNCAQIKQRTTSVVSIWNFKNRC